MNTQQPTNIIATVNRLTRTSRQLMHEMGAQAFGDRENANWAKY